MIDEVEAGIGRERHCQPDRLEERAARNYVLDSLFGGGDFVDLRAVPVADVRVELGGRARARRIRAGPWLAIANAATATGTTPFVQAMSSGWVAFSSAAGPAMNDRWEPTGGAGFNSPMVSVWTSDCSGRAPTSNTSGTCDRRLAAADAHALSPRRRRVSGRGRRRALRGIKCTKPMTTSADVELSPLAVLIPAAGSPPRSRRRTPQKCHKSRSLPCAEDADRTP